jgi:hypothetical protein
MHECIERNVFFFGLVIDTIEFKVFLTEEKIVKILSLCSSIPKEKKVTIRKFASLIGLVVHACFGCTFLKILIHNQRIIDIVTTSNSISSK